MALALGTIHDIGQADGIDFLVMELVPGQSLDRLIPKGGLPTERVVQISASSEPRPITNVS